MLGWLLALPPETAIQWERTALLLGPAVLAALLVLRRPPTPREASAAMLAFLRQVPSLLVLNALARAAGWWSFPSTGLAVLALPVDVWIGWAFWWGPCVAFLEKRLGVAGIVARAGALDVVGMPCLDLVRLGPGWLFGEAVFLLVGLLPGLLLARWTRLDRRPLGRTLVHASGWGAYMLFALPAVALASEGRDLLAAARMPAGILGWAGLAATALALLVGLAAALEFARVGRGTPVPVDPPKRVVMSGPYAYVANPMQVTSAVVMGLQAIHYGSPGLLLVTASFLLFDAVYAAHYNKVHIVRAMPRAWRAYKATVADWRVRWTPDRSVRASVLAGAAGAPSARVGGRLAGDQGIRLRHRPGREGASLVFLCPDAGVREDGLAALGRILERRNLAWALAAWSLTLVDLAGRASRVARGRTNETGGA